MFHASKNNRGVRVSTMSAAMDWIADSQGTCTITESDGVMWLQRWTFNDGNCIKFEISKQKRLNDEILMTRRLTISELCDGQEVSE